MTTTTQQQHSSANEEAIRGTGRCTTASCASGPVVRDSFKLRRGPRELHLELRVPDVLVVAVAELPRPVGGSGSGIAVAVRRRLSIPAEHLFSEAQQLEGPMPSLASRSEPKEYAEHHRT
jgi:hypothetical protein